ncbi:secretin and TonB N-terminal domain-containing protein [bacterium]|nr:secretin and TonB N-terminal domain-containing protein [bacterium]
MKRSRTFRSAILTASCLSLFMAGPINAAPLEYSLDSPFVRDEISAPDSIKLEGQILFQNRQNQPITISLRDADVKQVLRMFADKAGLNIILHNSVAGTVTLDLVNVTLEDAFKYVMKMNDLTYIVNDNTMMVVAKGAAEAVNISKGNIDILPVKYVDAGYVAQFLNSSIFNLGTPGLTYGPIVVTNPAKNELMIFGTDNDTKMAKRILEKLDKKPTMTTYKVNHTTPKQMAALICDTLFAQPASSPSSGTGTGSTLNSSVQAGSNSSADSSGVSLGGGVTSCVVNSTVTTDNISSYAVAPSLTIISQQELGTLTVIGGSDEQIQMINEFIIANDRKQPQAYLEVSIIELNEEGSKELQNEWTLTTGNIKISFSGDYDNGTTDFGTIPWDRKSGTAYGFSLSQKLAYITHNSKGRMLSNPKIILTNGEKSVIDLTSDYIESVDAQVLTSAQGIAGNAVQRTYNIANDNGIKIELEPFISPDGYISLTIKSDYASILRPVTAEILPDVVEQVATLLQRRNFELKNVRIKDEETLMLAGFITEEEAKKTSKIPGLGDVPVIGAFFRNSMAKKEKKELVILLTPRIIKDSEDVVEL